MPINKTLVWILAGGAAVALGGVAIWLWRRRANSAALAGDEQPEPEPPQPETPGPEGDEKPPREGLLDLEVRPVSSGPAETEPAQAADTTEPPAATTPAAAVTEDATAPERGHVYAVDRLREVDIKHVDDALSALWPTRPHGPELEPEVGDDMAFVARTRNPEQHEYQLEVVAARIHGIGEESFDVEILGNPTRRGMRAPQMDHSFLPGERIELARNTAAAIVKPEPPPVLVPKNRRKRYRVGPGELIELRPSKAPAEVLGWKPSRPDVAVRVVEQDGPRAVVALDGPIGEVSVALLAANGDGEPRPVCSWKFELVEKAA